MGRWNPPVTAPSLISRDPAVVKGQILDLLSDAVDQLLAADLTPRDAEKQTWAALLPVGRALLAALFAGIARRATEAELARTARSPADVKMRFDREYWFTTTTTFGRVVVPWFAFVDRRVEVPARAAFPLQARCRSSELCLEWEAALAADHPFRKAAGALEFFTHGAVRLEDTTVERHAVLVGQHVEREWLYRTPAEIREKLRNARRDKQTGRPLLYVSTDAHALRFLVGETWRADWKMVNGIRLWCVDDSTGALVHLGGEFVRGDCHAVVGRFAELRASGHLPKGGDFGDGVVAQLVLVTDGLEWIARHVVPLFEDALLSLDPYHVVEQVADAAKTLFPRDPRRARRLVREARRALGMRDRRERTWYRKGPRRLRHQTRHIPFRGSGHDLVRLLERLQPTTMQARRRLDTLLDYVRSNLGRLDYGALRNRGVNIGSGAMESLHRFGSQLRMKLSGSRWTPDVAHALLQLRMLSISGRWSEWWESASRAALVAGRGQLA
jgi:hypothetical protein